VCRSGASFEVTAAALAKICTELKEMLKHFQMQLNFLEMFTRYFTDWFVGVNKGTRGERVLKPRDAIKELAQAIGSPRMPFQKLCQLAWAQACDVSEILDHQGRAGWGAASLLSAEKLLAVRAAAAAARTAAWRGPVQ
jgi:hypothetical protein